MRKYFAHTWLKKSYFFLKTFQTNEKNSVVIVVPAVELFVAFVLVFISCELADRISVEFEQICNIISTSNWYAFPISYSKMLPTILANAQEDVYFECFGSIPCNRETFKRVGKLINQQLIEYHEYNNK